MRLDPDVQYVVAAYDLNLPRSPLTGRTGELLGRGTGSSLEFQEYREYAVGDDIRHLDWQAYARTDQLMVRLFRDEVSPRVEILLDVSRSMTTGSGAKERVTRQLTAACMLLAEKLGGRPRLILLGEEWPAPQFGLEDLDQLQDLPFDSQATLSELMAAQALPARQQAVRIVISDFLFPHDPQQLVGRLSDGASATWLWQLLTDWESEPQSVGGRHLMDVETGWEVDLMLNEDLVQGYTRRLRQLQQGLRQAGRRRRARLDVVSVDRGLHSACRDQLARAGLLRTQ